MMYVANFNIFNVIPVTNHKYSRQPSQNAGFKDIMYLEKYTLR